MDTPPLFSVVVPVYNRPDEALELLTSLAAQTCRDFELILVEDGSREPCGHLVGQFAGQVSIRYFAKDNTGAGDSRNFGIRQATGKYVVFFDSDCIIPPEYFARVKARLAAGDIDFWGGPDRAHPDFNALQKAISFTMTSWLTTGGIRGTRQSKGFLPRSFNMGIRREALQQLGGFGSFWPGEDLELAIRARKLGLRIALIPEAFVYHKRRTSLHRYYKQVRNFGRMRIHVYSLQGTGLKPLHWMPFAYMLYSWLMFPLAVLCWPAGLWFPALFGCYNLLLLGLSAVKHRSLSIGLLSVVTTQVMMYGYGLGLSGAFIRRYLLGKPVA
ncbi:MAG: glycosyltransferase [Bacteroidetes bacterium]|nr:glycosyltransferase [Bacteroidota bacterium]